MTALPVLKATRDCNGCAECCYTMQVSRSDSTTKRCGEWCENVVGDGKHRGCGIYASRWQPCRDFVCAWAAGLIPEDLWPAKTRCIVSFSNDGTRLTIYEHKDRPRASMSGAMGRWVSLVLDAGIPVVRVCGEHRSLIREV